MNKKVGESYSTIFYILQIGKLCKWELLESSEHSFYLFLCPIIDCVWKFLLTKFIFSVSFKWWKLKTVLFKKSQTRISKKTWQAMINVTIRSLYWKTLELRIPNKFFVPFFSFIHILNNSNCSVIFFLDQIHFFFSFY